MFRSIFHCSNVWTPLVLTRWHPTGYLIILGYDGHVSESCQQWRMFNLMVWRWCVFVFWDACPSAANYVGWTFVASTAQLLMSTSRAGFHFRLLYIAVHLDIITTRCSRTKRPPGFLSDDRSWSIIRLSSQAHWQLIYTQTALEVLEKLAQTRVP